MSSSIKGRNIDSAESKIKNIGLSLSLKNISAAGATLVFTQDNNIGKPTGELEYGEDFGLEVLKNGSWESAPIVFKGEWGINSIAYIIQSNGTSEREIRWEWLYGALKPGDYRIKKGIMDFRKTANFDKYTISAQFRLD